ncbi:MAG: hypothetical protein RLZZ244_514 [Verrucomicrobiota bacterium]
MIPFFMPRLAVAAMAVSFPMVLPSVGLAAASSPNTPGANAPGREIRFNRDIRPILSDNCFHCHGFDQKSRKGDRRLDVREDALKEKEGVRAVVPGDLSASEVHRRIHSQDADELMPPGKEGKKLTAEQKALLDEWIKQGAPYEEHWSYVAPVKAATQEGVHPVDELIGRRLSKVGLKPAPEADRRTLARRLAFDLVGLPPTPEEVAAFEKDSAPGAYERLVDRLMSSVHYGERMALPWLDVVRFADTIGYHSDNPRNVWPYRDYVIRAFNSNKPFDQFTREQLAGDLLPDATVEQRVGSGFNRLLLSTEEGGAQAKDYESRMLTDRVRALGTVWLGQTLGCAQCHDHKFDPVSTRDFYTIGAFFADIKEAAIGRREQGMLVPSPEEEARLKEHDSRIAELKAALQAGSPERDAAQAEWEKALSNGPVDVDWTPMVPTKVTGAKGSKFTIGEDGAVRVAYEKVPEKDTYQITLKTPPGGATGFRLEVLAEDGLPEKGPGLAADGGFVLNHFGVKQGATVLKLNEASATYEGKGQPAKQAANERPNDTSGWGILGKAGTDQAIYLELATALEGEKEITVSLRQTAGKGQLIGKFRLQATQVPAPVRAPHVQYPAPVLAAAKADPAKRSEAQKTLLSNHFRAVSAKFAADRRGIADATNARDEYEKSLPHCLVSVHTDQKRTVRILPRGDWQNETGEVVEPAVLHFLPQPKAAGERPLNRLDLADWVVSRSNPLTARVFVNRLWKQFFGIGLSKVLDDLGAQGEPPIHAELLDWLACEFMDRGWDVKHMVRLMVTSHAYRQVSTGSRELLAKDPYNRELARQSRWRLDAELVRDNALSVSGLLVPVVGGASVKPYQPEGYWENLNFPQRTYENDKGPSQYRRGMYTWWQRSYVQPSMLALDAPTREECTAERTRSNIPQQALVLLNDPSYVEAARSLAARILREGGGSDAQRLQWAFARVLQRAPYADEAAHLSGLLEKHRGQFASDAAAVDKLLGVGYAARPADLPGADLAAWTSICRVLLNLHETITRS